MRLGEGRLVHAALVGADGPQRVEVGKHAVAVGLYGIVRHQAMIRSSRLRYFRGRGRPCTRKNSRSHGAGSPELCQFVSLSWKRAQGKPGADCARSPRAKKSTGIEL